MRGRERRGSGGVLSAQARGGGGRRGSPTPVDPADDGDGRDESPETDPESTPSRCSHLVAFPTITTSVVRGVGEHRQARGFFTDDAAFPCIA